VEVARHEIGLVRRGVIGGAAGREKTRETQEQNRAEKSFHCSKVARRLCRGQRKAKHACWPNELLASFDGESWQPAGEHRPPACRLPAGSAGNSRAAIVSHFDHGCESTLHKRFACRENGRPSQPPADRPAACAPRRMRTRSPNEPIALTTPPADLSRAPPSCDCRGHEFCRSVEG
jgi:hypothetical protein